MSYYPNNELRDIIYDYQSSGKKGNVLRKLSRHALFENYLSESWYEFLSSICDIAAEFGDEDVLLAALNNARSFDDANSRNNVGDGMIYVRLFIDYGRYAGSAKNLAFLQQQLRKNVIDINLDRYIQTYVSDLIQAKNVRSVAKIFSYIVKAKEKAKSLGETYLRVVSDEDYYDLLLPFINKWQGKMWMHSMFKYEKRYGI